MDSFKLIKRPSNSLLISRSSKSRETLQTIPTPLDLLPPGFQKQGFGGPPLEILGLNVSFLKQIKIILQGSQILKNSSSFAVITDTVNIQSRNLKATMTTNGNQTDKSVQTKGNSRAWVLIMKARKMFLSSETPESGLLSPESFSNTISYIYKYI